MLICLTRPVAGLPRWFFRGNYRKNGGDELRSKSGRHHTQHDGWPPNPPSLGTSRSVRQTDKNIIFLAAATYAKNKKGRDSDEESRSIYIL